MPSRLADEREQRRGLILGLTLAEMLLLLLFLLLLALAAELNEWQNKANRAEADLAQLKPLQEAIYSGGAADMTSVQELVDRFRKLQEIEAEAKRLKEQNDRLVEQTELLKSLGVEKRDGVKALKSVLQRASQFDPNDPPALLKRAVDVLDRLGPETTPEQVRPLSEMMSNNELLQRLEKTEAERERYRLDVLNLTHSGNGLTYPSCWKTPTGQTEYIFDITLGDRSIRVHDATPSRAKDPAWELVGSFPRDTDISEKTFVATTKKLADWATSQGCKFYTRNRDETGPSNKDRYKYLRRTIEQNFYPYYPPAPSTLRRAKQSPIVNPPASTATAEPIPQ